MDSKAKRNQIIQTKILAQRLTNATFFEIEGWKRIPFFPKALEEFGFNRPNDSAELKFEEVELPISIGNRQFNSFQLGSTFAYKSHSKTFLV